MTYEELKRAWESKVQGLEAKDKPPVLALREVATGKVRFDFGRTDDRGFFGAWERGQVAAKAMA